MTQQFPGSKRAAKFLFTAFLLTAVAAFIWGFFVANKVRARAKQTDCALRSIAWACLCYVQQGDRSWPDSEASLLGPGASQDGSWTCESIAVQSEPWPSTREAAMAGLAPPATLTEALKMGGLEFSKNSSDAPHVNARGNPSGLDTLTTVNAWLTSYQSMRSTPLGDAKIGQPK